LEFTLVNDSGTKRALDQGHCWIKRLTIESAGVILEDINNYNRLVCGILQPAQGSAAYTGEMQLSMRSGAQQDLLLPGGAVAFGEPYFTNGLSALVDGAAAPTAAQNQKNGTGALGAAESFTGQYHLACGMLNLDKYLPLVLMGQGFTISIELAPGIELGCSAANGTGYEISNVRYVAHIVDMARDFYDMLRNLQVASGGSLMIGGSTFRHFTHTMTPGNGTENINISARVRSLEIYSLLVMRLLISRIQRSINSPLDPPLVWTEQAIVGTYLLALFAILQIELTWTQHRIKDKRTKNYVNALVP